MGEAIMIGMAEVKVTRSPDDVLMALGLGSCIGVCAYDPQAQVAGMAHVVLPSSVGFDPSPGKFADTAIPLLLERMTEWGADEARIQVALVGGAQIFAGNGVKSQLDIGVRNAEAVLSALHSRGIPVLAQDLGGYAGRTISLIANGLVRVKTLGLGERELISLGSTKAGPVDAERAPGLYPLTPPVLSAPRMPGNG